MNKEQEVEYYKKFPVILQAKLVNKEIILPFGTEFIYDPILAYRGIVRNKDDNTPLNMNDMKSYFELGKRPRGMFGDENQLITDPKYYAVSLFTSLEMLKQSFKFPRPNKKLAQGYVYHEGGPQCTGQGGHVSWWLYNDVDFSSFVIKGNDDG